MADAPAEALVVSSSPHVLGRETVPRIMHTVWLSLLPTCIAAVWFFGVDALRVLLLTTGSCIAFEALFVRLGGASWFAVRRAATDGSAVVTGVLLALCLPSSSPWWLVLVGGFVAMGLGKHIYGGLGNNPFNPALVARVFLLISFPTQMIAWSPPVAQLQQTSAESLAAYREQMSERGIDAATYATPLGELRDAVRTGEDPARLAQIRADIDRTYPLSALFLGRKGGSIGEVSALAILIGAAVLLLRGYITWHIPISFIATTAAVTGVAWTARPEEFANPLFHVLTGGVLLGAFFMATDMVIFGFGCGLVTAVIRLWGVYPEGVSFAILIMNGLVPILDSTTRPRRFGERTRLSGATR